MHFQVHLKMFQKEKKNLDFYLKVIENQVFI